MSAKLRKFIRRYYLNKMVQGGIWFLAAFALFFLLVNGIEYYSWGSVGMRTSLFYIYLAINVFILVRLVVIPLLKLFRIGTLISEEEAARIIGRHFPEVGDKLLNTLQLKRLGENNASLELLRAGIDQKTRKLQPIPFVRAIDLKKNRKYLRYAIPPLLIILILLFAAPSTITGPSERLIRHRAAFEKPLPFHIRLMNEKLEAVQQEDYTLDILVEGDELPAEIFLSSEGKLLPFTKTSGPRYAYTLSKLQQDMSFSILAGEYSFGPWYLKVLPKPVIIGYDVEVDYPAYTGKKDEVFNNTGDFVVPEGTKLSWKVVTRDARNLSFRFPDTSIILPAGSSNVFAYERRFYNNTDYSIAVANEHLSNPDTLAYSVSVIPDIYPTAIFEEFRDSIYEKRLYFRGQISDDYGFSALNFKYEFLNNFDTSRIEGKAYSEAVDYASSLSKQMIFHHFDLRRLNIAPGDEIAYYFEVWDNDAVNGAKSSRSHRMIFRAPSLEEINEQAESDNTDIKDEMEDIMRESQMLQRQLEKLNKELINKESLSWQEKEQIRQLLDQQEQLQKRAEMLQQMNLEKNAREQEYKQVNEDLLQKQQQLQELFEEVMTDEMKKLMEELQEMLDEISREDVNEMLEQMEENAADLEQELDKNLELFKQLEFDKKLTENIEKLVELAKKQEELAEESSDRKSDEESLAEEQQQLNEEFEDFRKEMDELEKLNDGLEKPHKMDQTDEQEESIEQDMQNSSENLQEGKKKKAGESQQSAAEKMQEMTQSLMDMQSQMQSQSNAEDIRVLREILENLLTISFDQEQLIADVQGTSTSDPRYPAIIEKQHEIEDNMQIVEDSLFALSKRQMAIESFVNKEVDNIRKNIADAYEQLEDRRKGDAAASQQYVMTSVNNLALLLSEALAKMQQIQNMNMPGNSSCDNPGGNNPSSMPQTMSQMQEQLNKQMQEMKNGQKKNGQGGKMGQKSMSEQFARMAAEQEAVRRQMQEYLEQLKAMGETGDAGLNKLMDDMEKTELDLVNKQLTEETMKRQEEIMTRLLKHEKAMRQREKEERRESNEAKMQEYSNPNNFLEYKRLLLKEVELLKTVPPDLKPFYKRKVNEYFYNFGN